MTGSNSSSSVLRTDSPFLSSPCPLPLSIAWLSFPLGCLLLKWWGPQWSSKDDHQQLCELVLSSQAATTGLLARTSVLPPDVFLPSFPPKSVSKPEKASEWSPVSYPPSPSTQPSIRSRNMEHLIGMDHMFTQVGLYHRQAYSVYMCML